ncbi:MAG TPA: Xaa-Pro peptidase family protein [Candidatus Saccharimonadales bacterium]|nr:Xaa-Pro peptidase family protein [Candidatus Saccharimonadales bacterium]
MNDSSQRNRVKILQHTLEEKGFDAIIFLDQNCHRTLTGTWHITTADPVEACIIPAHQDPILIVHANTRSVVGEETWIKDIRERIPFPLSFVKPSEPKSLANMISEILGELKSSKNKIAIDENRTPLSIVRAVEKARNVTFEGVAPLLDSVLGIRSTEEIELLRKAARIADDGMKAAFEAIKPEKRECEVAAECVRVMVSSGADRLWFPLVVCSGTRSGIPYAYATEKVIKKGDLVQLDFGPVYNGCYADLSRARVAGQSNSEQQKIYNIVLEANRAAISAIKPGIKAGEIDRASRKIIDDAGYGEYSTTHHTGHPVGFIYGPEIEPTNQTTIKEGMTFTIEPGIYIPSKFGIRVEDNVLVTKSGCEVLTQIDRTCP